MFQGESKVYSQAGRRGRGGRRCHEHPAKGDSGHQQTTTHPGVIQANRHHRLVGGAPAWDTWVLFPAPLLGGLGQACPHAAFLLGAVCICAAPSAVRAWI